MTLLALIPLPPQRYLGPDPEEGGLLLDAVLEEEIGHSADVTQQPIELGAKISDHFIVNPQTYRMVGAVTDTPIAWWRTTYQNTDGSTRSQSAYSILQALHEAGELFTLRRTGFLDKKNMVIRSFSSVRDAERANVFQFEAQLQQLIIVETQEVTITPDMIEAETRAEEALAEENSGNQATEEVGTFASDGFDAIVEGVEDLGDYFKSLMPNPEATGGEFGGTGASGGF